VTGCTEVSEGCDHGCARTFAERWRGIPDHPYEQGFDVRLWPERLEIFLGASKPARQPLTQAQSPLEFVQSTGLFIKGVMGC
jgi:hypothetical protein